MQDNITGVAQKAAKAALKFWTGLLIILAILVGSVLTTVVVMMMVVVTSVIIQSGPLIITMLVVFLAALVSFTVYTVLRIKATQKATAVRVKEAAQQANIPQGRKLRTPVGAKTKPQDQTIPRPTRKPKTV